MMHTNEEIAQLVHSGKLSARGFHHPEEIKTVVELVRHGDAGACKQLVGVINKPDSEGCLSSVEVCRIVTHKEEGCLSQLLDLGFAGELELHNEIKKSEIETGELIGRGKAGQVFMGKYKQHDVAIKMFVNPEKIDDKEFRKEISIMSLVREPNLILTCYGGSTKKGNKFIVTELMEGSVFEVLHDKGVEIDEHIRLIMAISIAKSVEFLHSCNLIHRDLKSLNLLVNKHFEIKICDFGLSRIIDKHAPMTGNVGTVCWIAPEIYNNKKLYSEKADVYSYGIILWELLMREMPFGDTETFTIPVLVTKGKRPKIPKHTAKEWSKLIEKCWHQKPEKRPDFPQILVTLDAMWAAFHHKNPQLSKPVAFELSKEGQNFKLNTIDEAAALAKHYPAHAIWGPPSHQEKKKKT
eukprot:TRINITY_DN26133_c0_g1_i1.p1 TRINITY_DN26133_c0_g1~~TRINITY_DN26133_c0_g1_i1.p1  ORF type:complete len:409 (-),score=85.07 TRINITY_DN26133_c0_g1_i1:108-1334(-)